MKIKFEKSKIFLAFLIMLILCVCIVTIYSSFLLRQKNIASINSKASTKCVLATPVYPEIHRNELAELSSTDRYICGTKDCGDATAQPQMYCDINNNCSAQNVTNSCFGNICKNGDNYCSAFGIKCSKDVAYKCGANICNKDLSYCIIDSNSCASESDARCL